MSTLHRTALLAGLLIALTLLPAHAQDATQCTQEYAQAETAYFDADFDRAVRLLRTCLEEADLAPDAQVRLYRLLSFAYIAQNERAQARAAIEQLLTVDPDYTPDPETDRPDYVALVREVRATHAPDDAENGGRRWLRWVLGGAGAVAAGVLTIVLVGGGDDGGDTGNLPAPPTPPN
jgi:tetratricopeptide (TPR) repeat protein